MKKILVIGHSHMTALHKSQKKDKIFEFHSLYREKAGELCNKINCNNYQSVVLLIGGNRHNILGLLNHPVSFDFYLPERINSHLKPGSKIIPLSLMKKIFERELTPVFNITVRLVEFFKKNNINKIYQVESPPPVSSEIHIKKYLDRIFKEKVDEYGVSPIEFRYKLWRLHSKIVKEKCEQLGVTFIEVPNESQDSNGYLCEKYWNQDATHANALYGDLVLNQIRTIHNISLT